MKLLLVLSIFISNLSWCFVQYDEALILDNVYKVIKKRSSSHFPEHLPGSIKDINVLRHEKNGVIDFIYTSKNKDFRVNIYCHFSQLLRFKEKYSNPSAVCFRINVHKFNNEGVNSMGMQVGIY